MTLFLAAMEKKEKKVKYAKVLYDYKPQAAGELKLHTGDTIKNVERLSKGWCKVRESFVLGRGYLQNSADVVVFIPAEAAC